MAEKTFTRKQIAEWVSKDETVFIIDNIVYNVTKFLDEHPGGHEVLVNANRKDASEDFEDVGHSFDAKELMKKFVIGEIVAEEHTEVKKKQINWDDTKPDTDNSFLTSWKFPVLLGVVVTLLYSYLFG